MGHLQIFGEELREKLHSRISHDELITWVKDRVLQSYKNGLAAAQGKPANAASRQNHQVKRGENRPARSDAPPH